LSATFAVPSVRAAAAGRMTDLIERGGHRMYASAAARLRAAVRRPPTPGDWPRLLWVLVK
jgi:hypothetical protein